MRITLAATLVAATVLAVPAEAQLLKKLKKPLAKAVPTVVGNSVGGSAGGGIRTAPIQFDDKVLEITPDRLQQLVKGLEAEVAMVARVEAQDLAAIDRANEAARAAYDREYEAYRAKKDAFNTCSDGFTDEMRKENEGLMPSGNQQARMEAVGKRIEAAKAKGDLAEVKRLADSLVASMAGANARLMQAGATAQPRLLARCGQPPAEPAKPVYTQALGYETVDRAGLEASGFDDLQYRILRERVAPFVASGGKSSSMAYTESEVQAMSDALPTLEKFGSHLKRY